MTLYHLCIQADFGENRVIQNIHTSGNGQRWITAYNVSVSEDGETFCPVTTEGGSVSFVGNTDGSTEVINPLDTQVVARYVRLTIEAFNVEPKLRWGVFGCSVIPQN